MALAAMALVMAGCYGRTIYSHYEPTPIGGWEKNDTVTYMVKDVKLTADYLEEVGLRINDTYPFTGLTLVVEQRIMPAGIRHRDTLSAKLIDEDGNTLGKGFNFYEFTFPLCTLSLQKGDSISIAIYHNMKRQMLPGISDIGITLRQTEQ